MSPFGNSLCNGIWGFSVVLKNTFAVRWIYNMTDSDLATNQSLAVVEFLDMPGFLQSDLSLFATGVCVCVCVHVLHCVLITLRNGYSSV
jgi:hypothetical protein